MDRVPAGGTKVGSRARVRAPLSERSRTVIAALVGGLVVAVMLLAPQFADAHPDHSAGVAQLHDGGR